MDPQTAPPAAARRPPTKLWIAAAGATLALLLVLGGLLAWMWPALPAARKAKAPRPAPQVAAPQAPPQVVVADAPAVREAAPPAREPAAEEASLDRLQRRLGEVLGARGAVDAAQPGEWRVLTRVAVAPAAPQDPAWSYSGLKGPQAWARLHPDFALCAGGRLQSPIDIRGGQAMDLEPIRFDYRPGAFGIVDDGHTVRVNVTPGNAIELDGRRYELQQFHFHRPSEERIGGRRYEMSAHFEHRDAEGRLAVVVVMLERGDEQPLLRTLWAHLPLEKRKELMPEATLDPAQLLPADRRYYRYMGSLTTPPCSEGVLWLVLQQPVAVSARQIDAFADLYPMNARPVQQAAGRQVRQSN